VVKLIMFCAISPIVIPWLNRYYLKLYCSDHGSDLYGCLLWDLSHLRIDFVLLGVKVKACSRFTMAYTFVFIGFIHRYVTTCR